MYFDLGPLMAAPFPIAPHALFALLALVVGAVQLRARKGTLSHKYLGYLWVGSMATVAASGFFIHEIELLGPFSPIHLLSVFVLVMLFISIRAARRRDMEVHRKSMIYMYVLGLMLTGAFTLLPGRTMHTILFGN